MDIDTPKTALTWKCKLPNSEPMALLLDHLYSCLFVSVSGSLLKVPLIFIFICGLHCCCQETPKVYQQCILFLCKCGSRSPFATDFIVVTCAAEVILSMLFGCNLYFETCPHFVMCTDLNLLQLAAVLKPVTKGSRITQQSFLEIPSSVSVFRC